MTDCILCNNDAGVVVFRNALLRIVLAQNEPDYPATCRVILNRHAAEMTDLDDITRNELMTWVWRTEHVLRETLHPDKINLASLGNQVPHVHWHVIPRFTDDAHFPAAIWAPRVRNGVVHGYDALEQELRKRFANLSV